MGALEEYIRSQRRVANRRDPMKGSLMNEEAAPSWEPEYIRKGGHALEVPMLSPDDLIGTGIPSKVGLLASKLTAPAAAKMSAGALAALGGKGLSGIGFAGMLMGPRGVARLGDNRLADLLGKETDKAVAMRRAGEDTRIKHNSGHPLVHTGYDMKPWYEFDDFLTRPRNKDQLAYDKEVPFLQDYQVRPEILKAYPELEKLKVLNSTTDATGGGSFNHDAGLLTLGYGPSANANRNAKYAANPDLRHQTVREALGHELQHGISGWERSLQGSDTEPIRSYLKMKNRGPELNRYVARASFLDTLAQGGMDPMEAIQMFAEGGTDKGTLRQLQRYVEQFRDGRLSKEDALSHGFDMSDAARRVMTAQGKRQRLQGLLDNGIVQVASPEVRQSAQYYITNPGNIMKGDTPEETLNHYVLYRANAGENQAEGVGSRMEMGTKARQLKPFAESTQFPVEYLHNIGFAGGGVVRSPLDIARSLPSLGRLGGPRVMPCPRPK